MPEGTFAYYTPEGGIVYYYQPSGDVTSATASLQDSSYSDTHGQRKVSGDNIIIKVATE